MTTSLIALVAILGPQPAVSLFTTDSIAPNAGSLASLSARDVLGAPVDLTVDLKDGDTVGGLRTFKVTVQTEEVVTQVEFYVNGELRATERSTPYKFEVDTLNEKDGPATFKFIAYTDQAHKGTKEFKINVDNGLSKGIDFHVKKGAGLVQEGKYEDAISEGRIALKIDKKNSAARLLLARAYLLQGVLDKAQRYADDVASDDPKNLAALDIASAIGLKQAFNTSAKNMDDAASLDAIKGAYKSAVENRQKYLDGEVDALGAVTDANRIALAAANVRAGHFTTGINLLSPLFGKDPSNVNVANHLAYAQLRRGRFQDAAATYDLLKKSSSSISDPYALALIGLIDSQLGSDSASDAAIQDALLADINNIGVRTSQASIALRTVTTAGQPKNYSNLQSMVTGLAKDAGSRTEVDYLICSLYNRLLNFSTAKKYFEFGVLAEPTNYDLYIEEGNASISIAQNAAKTEKKTKDFEYAQAELMFSTALVAKPDSHQALAGLAIAYLLEGKKDLALKYARAAAKTEASYPAGLYALSAALSANGQDDEGGRVAQSAWKFDKELDGRPIPSAAEAWRYYNARGRSPIITPPGI